jgi:hypothetical protein
MSFMSNQRQSKKSFKGRRVLAIITFLASIPSFTFVIRFISTYSPTIAHWVIWEKGCIILFCLAGSILLWQGNVWGYRLSIIGWALIIFVQMSIVIIFLFDLSKSNIVDITASLSINILFILVGVSSIYVLLRDIIRNRNNLTPPSH